MNKKGNAMVEFAMGMAVFSLSLALFLFTVNASLVKWTVLETAQLGTDLQALTELPAPVIKTVLSENLKRKRWPIRAQWSIDVGPPTSSPAARFYNLVQTKVTARLPGNLTLEESVVSQKESYE